MNAIAGVFPNVTHTRYDQQDASKLGHAGIAFASILLCLLSVIHTVLAQQGLLSDNQKFRLPVYTQILLPLLLQSLQCQASSLHPCSGALSSARSIPQMSHQTILPSLAVSSILHHLQAPLHYISPSPQLHPFSRTPACLPDPSLNLQPPFFFCPQMPHVPPPPVP